MRRNLVLAVSLTVICAATLAIAPKAATAAEPSIIATVAVGNGVAGIAVNPNTNRIYVANSIDNTVSVIDGATNTVIATIPVGLTPDGIDVNPNTNQVYIANTGSSVDSGKAAVIDGNTNTVVATIPIAYNAPGVAVNSTTNRIYITTRTNSTFLPYVEVIDGATNTLAADILPLGNNFNPQGISANSTTNQIYVADTATNSLEVVDGASNTLTGVIPLTGVGTFPSTFGIDVNSITNRVYVAGAFLNCICIGNIAVVDGATNTVTPIPVPPVNGNSTSNAISIGVNPTTNHVFVAERQSGSVLTLDGATNKFIFSPIPGVGGSGDITANPTTNRVYVATNGNQVSVIADAPNVPPTPTPTPTPTVTPTPTPTIKPRKVVVFLQGVCTAISKGTSSVDIDSSFNDLQNLLLTPEYRYKDSDFLLYSYNGGFVDKDGIWHHNAYKENNPINTDFQTLGLFTLHNQLLIPYYDHPKHQNITFILVGHSLGGVVAMEEVVQKIGSSDYRPRLLSTIITIDSPLHGIPSDLATASALTFVPKCARKGVAEQILVQIYPNARATTEKLAQAKQQGVTVVNIGNSSDCLFGPNNCGVAVTGDIRTQWLFDSDAIPGIFNVPCSKPINPLTVIYCFNETHSAVLHTSLAPDALRTIANYIGGQN
jgi:YVTN family beta-propeller protein